MPPKKINAKEQIYPPAYLAIGNCYLNGIGVQQDNEEGRKNIQITAPIKINVNEQIYPPTYPAIGNGAPPVPSNTVTIKIFTPRSGTAATKSLTLYGTINGMPEKYLLCRDKNIGWGSTNIFTIQRPSNIKTIDFITLEVTNTNNCWGPNSFVFELPDNKIWTFTGGVSFGSHKAKIIKYNTQPSIIFYFTGPKAGTIKTAKPYNKIVPEWATQVKGKLETTTAVPNSQYR